MGYCEMDCKYLSSRHNCKKYRKRLAYTVGVELAPHHLEMHMKDAANARKIIS